METRKNNSASDNIEYRTYRADLVSDQGGRTVKGHAAVFNIETRLWGQYYEVIAPGAFTEALLDSDVKFLIDHQTSPILGRYKSGRSNNTLSLAEDKIGLLFESTLPVTRDDTKESVERGDLSECSFAFTVLSERIEERADGSTLVTILKVKRLYDVSLVAYPAYPGTDASLKSEDISQSYRSAIKAFEDEKKKGADTDPEPKPDQNLKHKHSYIKRMWEDHKIYFSNNK